MKNIVTGFLVLVTVTLFVGVIVGASAYLFFNWTPLTHYGLKSFWGYLSHWKVITLILSVWGAGLFVRQVVTVLNRNH
jgi:hypothetical protein